MNSPTKKPFSHNREIIEEMAAIREYDGCMTRWLAERTVAKDQGFNTWSELVRACK